VIEKLGDVLAPFPNPIRVEGHTDDRPIKTLAFFSNWELSAARAGSVVRVLASRGVDAARLAVIGYGENRPAQSNATEAGRNANRRVIIVILSTDAASRDAANPATDAASRDATNPAAAETIEAAAGVPAATAPAATPAAQTDALSAVAPPVTEPPTGMVSAP
jgi:chemotaxis protein MotB